MKSINLPMLYMGSTEHYKTFMKLSGFLPTEVKLVKNFMDVYGHKDTVIFLSFGAHYKNYPEMREVIDYTETHNIRKVAV